MAIKYQNYITGDDAGAGIIYGSGETTGFWYGQTFTVSTTHKIVYVKLKLYRLGSPGIIVCDLYNAEGTPLYPIGTPLATGSYDGDTLTASSDGEWITITFDIGVNLVASGTYALVLKSPYGYNNGGSAGVYWRKDGSSASYSGGTLISLSSSVGSWQQGATNDMMFEEWGTPIVIAEQQYVKSLVAIGNNEVWYGISKDNMAELTAAHGDIDTNKPLMAVEAFQKLYVVNETNLKVIDFVNTKLSTTDAGVNPCTKGMTLTGGSSTATLAVDYVTAVTDDAEAVIYGFLTSTKSFTTSETVTGTNSDGDSVSFVLDSNSIPPTVPHWYNWTVFGNDTSTYGTMPTSSSLVALYRGRLVLNDNNRPHAWYMFKIGDPGKIIYDFANDEQLSAVTFANSRVGVVGDILTDFISISDDLFVFGCQNSIWVLVGDPLAEGQLTQLTADTGIWGSRAWCVDDKNNLYFLGNNGVYRCSINIGLSKPENISKFNLPTLMADLSLDKSLHRVVLAFDPVKNGIIITRTLLSDGTNTGYWLSLTTSGFFPETYPSSCGIFSTHFYPATDGTYKKFLVGCNDGYIREFANDVKNDITTSGTAAISSYCLLLQKLGRDDNHNGMLREVTGITGGGASGGDFSDTDTLSYAFHVANDAETVIENVIDGATAFTTGTWSGPGKQNKIRPRARGVWCGINLSNTTAAETWAINSVTGEVIPKGRA